MGEKKNLYDQKAVSKLKELVNDIRVCMFTTDLSQDGAHTRPMSTQEVDENGDIWFFSGDNSHKNMELKQKAETELYYAHPGKEEYLYVKGHADIIRDRTKIDEHWSPVVKAWFEGRNDPDLTLICVHPEQAYYWDTKNGKAVELIKIAKSMFSDKKSDDGIEGNLSIH